MSETTIVETRGKVAYVTLNRPEALNALNATLKRDLTNDLHELDGDPAVHVIVLKGAGRAFCAGQDQKESAQFRDSSAADKRIDLFVDMFEALRHMSKPIIAQIHGYAVGGGLQVALLADLRIASPSARFGLTELNVGSPAITGSALLWPIAGEAVVKRLVLTAELVYAPEALTMGIVHEVVEETELAARVDHLADIVAEKPASTVKLQKEWWRVLTEPLFQQAVAHAHGAHAKNFLAGEFSHGATSFVSRARR